MNTKRWTGMLAAGLVLAAAGCSNATSHSPSGGSGGAAAAPADPAKVSGTITVLTNRTDLVKDGTLKKYADQFNQVYPNVTVKFEGHTDYEGDVKIRMSSSDYGDVLLIPNALGQAEYPRFFADLGSATALGQKYRFVSKATVNGEVYGLAQNGNAVGFVYNKAVWAKAGITDWPKSPDEFLADLGQIKAKTGAIPYYTNYKDGWPITKWQDALGAASCDVDAGDALASSQAPWAAGTELNTIDTLMYDVVKRGYSEADPTTTNWEKSKSLLGTGQIGTMWLGSWAVSQMQAAATAAGGKADDIGFMPFPAQPNGKFCTVAGPDYQLAVSIHSAHKDAARAWVDWFVDKSTYAQDQGDVPTLKSAALPAALQPFQNAGVNMIELSQAKTATVNTIDDASEIGLTKPDYRQHIIDLARGAASGSLESDFADLNKKWSEAVKTAGS
ncbi:ABC transporter substrate-binding protein [Catenulispora subtropica]|uniref:Extracellular solute-binding protein n=1 Tax=Catenulispora subtropica TaxID=450798 RepID=A0ABN2SKZ9_9ACTN